MTLCDECKKRLCLTACRPVELELNVQNARYLAYEAFREHSPMLGMYFREYLDASRRLQEYRCSTEVKGEGGI